MKRKNSVYKPLRLGYEYVAKYVKAKGVVILLFWKSPCGIWKLKYNCIHIFHYVTLKTYTNFTLWIPPATNMEH